LSCASSTTPPALIGPTRRAFPMLTAKRPRHFPHQISHGLFGVPSGAWRKYPHPAQSPRANLILVLSSVLCLGSSVLCLLPSACRAVASERRPVFWVIFKHISLFDFTEKRSPLRPGGMNRGSNIFDYLEQQKVQYHTSSPENGEAANLASLTEELRRGEIDFAFLYLPELDGLLRRVGNDSPLISAKLRQYEDAIRRLAAKAGENYKEVRLYLFSDHGMANCGQLLDLKRQMEELPLRFGHDYAAVYDSTMARFWFLNERARQLICDRLQRVPQGRILTDGELEELGTLFPDSTAGITWVCSSFTSTGVLSFSQSSKNRVRGRSRSEEAKSQKSFEPPHVGCYHPISQLTINYRLSTIDFQKETFL
jgi:hypothetical protein